MEILKTDINKSQIKNPEIGNYKTDIGHQVSETKNRKLENGYIEIRN